MKNNSEVKFIRSFRFKIVLYTILSLIYTALTEIGLFLFIKGMRAVLLPKEDINMQMQSNQMLNNTINDALNNAANNNLKNQPVGNGDMPPLFGGDPEHTFLTITVIVITGIVIFTLYFLTLTKKFSIYLKEIVSGINKISKGDLSARIYIKDSDEFGIIGDRLNAMAEDIRILMENERKNEKVKNDLITNVAHDLRTPLTSIIGYLDLTIREPDMEAEKRKKYISVAYDKSLRLEKLIGDLFSFTKFNSGEVKLNLSQIDIVKLMEQMMDEFYPSFQDAGLNFEFATDRDTAIVIADGDLLARAFSNLISNAVKYGKDGKSLKVKVTQTEKLVKITITNYGEVIPEKDIGRIFDRFYRVETSRNTETGGTGLGLAIAKRAVLLHGGTITASSTLEGTVFEITLKKEDVHEK